MSYELPPDATYEEYTAMHALLTAALVKELVEFLVPYQSVTLLPRAWVNLLAKMYPIVERYRYQSGNLARQFHDYERQRRLDAIDQTQDLPEFEDVDNDSDIPVPTKQRRHDVYLAGYDPDWFYEAMEPVRETFAEKDADDASLRHAVQTAVKEVENGGRRTMREAVETDERAIGWARVQGGNESCAFCLTLISRGPVYKSAESAGGMNQWHDNCDCKVVAVYDRNNWTGRDAYLQAEQIWINAPGRNSYQKMASIRRMLEGRRSPALPAAA